MAKKRQGIHAIQAALLSHVQYIGNEEHGVGENAQPAPLAHEAEAGEVLCQVEIEPDVMRKLQALARYQHTDVQSLVHLALDDLLALRRRQLAAALSETDAE